MPKFDEKFIRWIWEYQKLRGVGAYGSPRPSPRSGNTPLQTESGKRIEIISPGIPNQEDGPDFKNSIIKLDKTLLKGDIEIHLSSNSWFEHQHQIDPKYNKVILHVVTQYGNQPAITESKNLIETFNLSRRIKKPLSKLIKEYIKEKKAQEKYTCPYVPNSKVLLSILKEQGKARFKEREIRFKKLIKDYGQEQSAYIGIMESLGYVKNEKPFIKLAQLVPIDYLKSLTSNKSRSEKIKLIQVTLLEVGGLLPNPALMRKQDYEKSNVARGFMPRNVQTMKKEEWQFFKVRPSIFPTKRIRDISYFLADIIQDGICNFLITTFPDIEKIKAKFSQAKMGKSTVEIIILNVVLPLLSTLNVGQGFSLANKIIQIYMNYKPLPENNITKLMTKRLLIKQKLIRLRRKEIYYQGMIHIFKHYCQTKSCSTCPIRQLTDLTLNL
ncbi:DUF2851 family protein [candidate division WOR-3 bacterium]|nr:DUF2851 family protein [candidate division WOR-3 bacterium]